MGFFLKNRFNGGAFVLCFASLLSSNIRGVFAGGGCVFHAFGKWGWGFAIGKGGISVLLKGYSDLLLFWPAVLQLLSHQWWGYQVGLREGFLDGGFGGRLVRGQIWI